jgi:arylsulfatase A-like enzyme
MVYHNASPYDGTPTGWGHVLQGHGIRVESIGKLHYRAEEDPAGFYDLHAGKALPQPKLHPDGGYLRHPWVPAYAEFERNEENFSSPQERHAAFVAYCGLTIFLDHHVGQLVQALESSGLAEDTVVICEGRWKYHYHVRFRPELFDLEADPQELHDLSQDRAHAEILREMERALRRIADPEAIDAQAKADQRALIARFGGIDKASRMGAKGATPAPGAAARDEPPGEPPGTSVA